MEGIALLRLRQLPMRESRTFIAERRLGTPVLTEVVDHPGSGKSARLRSAFDAVEARLAAHGLRVRLPVSAEIVDIPIMGATKSDKEHHTLFVAVGALRSSALEGLVAHEMGHIIRTESGHASHSPAVFKQIGSAVRIPTAARAVFGEAFNHMQDIYADDLSFEAGLNGRAYEFFSSWVTGHRESARRDRWWNVGVSVSNGFALGNLLRHRLLEPDDPLWAEARTFDREVRLRSVDTFATFFASLPADPKPRTFVSRVQELADSMAEAHDSRMF